MENLRSGIRAKLKRSVDALASETAYRQYGFSYNQPKVDAKRIVFQHIPRSGGTSIDIIFGKIQHVFYGIEYEKMFVKDTLYKDIYEIKKDNPLNWRLSPSFDMKSVKSENFSFLSQHFSFEDFNEVPDSYFKISVIRDPYERYVSHCIRALERTVGGKSVDAKTVYDVCRNVLIEHQNIYCQRIFGGPPASNDSSAMLSHLEGALDDFAPLDAVDRIVTRLIPEEERIGLHAPVLNAMEETNPETAEKVRRLIDTTLKDPFDKANESDRALYSVVLEREKRLKDLYFSPVSTSQRSIILLPPKVAALLSMLRNQGIHITFPDQVVAVETSASPLMADDWKKLIDLCDIEIDAQVIDRTALGLFAT